MNYYAEGGQTLANLTQEMPPSKIIMDDLSRKASPEEVQQTLASLETLSEQNKLFILQENNTIIVLISIGDGIVEAHLFTLDNALTMARSFKILLEELKRSQLTRMYSNVDDDTPKLLALMHKFGVQSQESDKPEYVWMADI
jgi:hypothetical protein